MSESAPATITSFIIIVFTVSFRRTGPRPQKTGSPCAASAFEPLAAGCLVRRGQRRSIHGALRAKVACEALAAIKGATPIDAIVTACAAQRGEAAAKREAVTEHDAPELEPSAVAIPRVALPLPCRDGNRSASFVRRLFDLARRDANR